MKIVKDEGKIWNLVFGFEGTTDIYGPVAQLVRAPPCHGGGRGFESHPGRLTEIEYGILAQLGEHLPYKQRVIGSSPIGPTSNIMTRKACQYLMPMWLNWQSS